MTVWKIKDWDKAFECAESRKLEKLSYVQLRLKLDGLVYKRLMRRDGGCEAYTVFMALVQVAARGGKGKRGTLERDGVPLTLIDLEDLTSIPANVIERSIEILKTAEIGWLVGENGGSVGEMAPNLPKSLEIRHDPPTNKTTRTEQTQKNQQQQQQCATPDEPSPTPELAAAAAAAAAEIPDLAERRKLLRRDEWVPEGKPWLTPRAAEIIARSSATTDEIRQVLKLARDSRKTLANPAGYVVSQLSRLRPDAKDRREAG